MDHYYLVLLVATQIMPSNISEQAKIDGAPTVFENFTSSYASNKKRMERLSEPEIKEKVMEFYIEATSDQGTARQAANKGFSVREILGNTCNIISTRLRAVLRGRSTIKTHKLSKSPTTSGSSTLPV